MTGDHDLANLLFCVAFEAASEETKTIIENILKSRSGGNLMRFFSICLAAITLIGLGCATTHTLLSEGPITPMLFTVNANVSKVYDVAGQTFASYHFQVFKVDPAGFGLKTSSQPFNSDGKSSSVGLLRSGGYYVSFMARAVSVNDSVTTLKIHGTLSSLSSGLFSASANEESIKEDGAGYKLLTEIVEKIKTTAEHY